MRLRGCDRQKAKRRYLGSACLEIIALRRFWRDGFSGKGPELDIFDVRTLFLGPMWIAAGTTAWMCSLAFAGAFDANGRPVALIHCLLVAAWPLALVALGLVGLTSIGLALATILALAFMWWMGEAGLLEPMILPPVVLALGFMGVVAIAVGLLVRFIHGLMDHEDDEDAMRPIVAYVSLPACLIVAAALAMAWLPI